MRKRMTTDMKTLFREDIAKLCLKKGITTRKIADRLPKRWHNHFANEDSLQNGILYHAREAENLAISGNGKKLIFKVEEYDGPDETITPSRKPEPEPELVEDEPEAGMNIDRDFCVAEINNLAEIEREALARIEHYKMVARSSAAKRMAMKEFLAATDKLTNLGVFQIE